MRMVGRTAFSADIAAWNAAPPLEVIRLMSSSGEFKIEGTVAARIRKSSSEENIARNPRKRSGSLSTTAMRIVLLGGGFIRTLKVPVEYRMTTLVHMGWHNSAIGGKGHLARPPITMPVENITQRNLGVNPWPTFSPLSLPTLFGLRLRVAVASSASVPGSP